MALVVLVLVLAMSIGSAGTVGAGKPQQYLNGNAELLIYDDAGIYGEAGEVYIDYSLQWENIGAWGYKVEWGPAADPDLYFDIGGGKKLRKLQTTLKLSIPEGDVNEQYSINATLLDRSGNPIGWWDADTLYPGDDLTVTTTAIFAEHFTGVASDELPSEWSTNATSQCYAQFSDYARGVEPELSIDYGGEYEYDYCDYWVATPEILTAPATTNLTLSFDYYFDLWQYQTPSYPYTILVEVSATNGTTWATTSFVDSPNMTKYPSGVIGPEKVNIDLSTYAGQTIMIRWRAYGYTYNYDYWYVDNIVLTGY